MASGQSGVQSQNDDSTGSECMSFVIDCQHCQKPNTIPFDRAHDERYKNWIRASLCIQYTKEGMEVLVEDIAKEIFSKIKQTLDDAASCCDFSSFDDKKFNCKQCNKLKKAIERECVSSFKSMPNWNATSKKEIRDSSMVFKLFLPQIFYHYDDPKHVDCTALCSYLEATGKGNAAVDQRYISQVRTARNEIMHSGTMRIERNNLKKYGDFCLKLLDNITHTSDQSKKMAEEKRGNIKEILEGNFKIGFQKAEQIALDQHDTHVEIEIKAIENVIASEDLTPQKFSEKKAELEKLKEDQLKRGAVMAVMNIPPKKTEKLKQFADEVYKKMEEKQIKESEVSTKVDKMEKVLIAAIENLGTEVGKLQKELNSVNVEVADLKKQKYNPVEYDKTKRTSYTGTTTGSAKDRTEGHTQENDENNTNETPDWNLHLYEDKEGGDCYSNDEPHLHTMDNDKSDTHEASSSDTHAEEDNLDLNGDEEAPDVTGSSRSRLKVDSHSDDNENIGSVDKDGKFTTMCKTIHGKVKQLYDAGMIPSLALTTKTFPLCCEIEGCFCERYQPLLWNLSKLAYHCLVSNDANEAGTSDGSHDYLFGMSKNDLEYSQKIGILKFNATLEEAISHKDLSSVYFINSQQQSYFVAMYLSTQTNQSLVHDIMQKLHPDLKKVTNIGDLLIYSAKSNPMIVNLISEHIMTKSAEDESIQEHRTTATMDTAGTNMIMDIQTLLTTATKEMMTQQNVSMLRIDDIMIQPGNISEVMSALRLLKISEMKSVVLKQLHQDNTAQVFDILSKCSYVSKLNMTDCEISSAYSDKVIRDSLCVLDLRNIKMPHDVYSSLFRNLSLLKQLKYMRIENLFCSTHDKGKDKCDGLDVHLTGHHDQLENIWIVDCLLSEIEFHESANKLKIIYISGVKMNTSCFGCIRKTLPKHVQVCLWYVTIKQCSLDTCMIKELRGARDIVVSLDKKDEEKVEMGVLINRFEFKKL